jgi:hypothetical protein
LAGRAYFSASLGIASTDQHARAQQGAVVAIEEAESLQHQMRAARARIREMSEMLVAARTLDEEADGDSTGAFDRSEQGAFLLALALDLAVSQISPERAVDELIEVSHGSPMALLGARSRAVALQRELSEDKRAHTVVDLLTRAVRKARVNAFQDPVNP